MQRYDSYKDSGIQWLGEIPSHWEVKKMKWLFTERTEKGHPNEPLLAATQNHGVILKDQYENRTVEATKSLDSLKLVKPEDFVISLRSFQGGIEMSYAQGIISPAYTILIPQGITSGYFKHLGKSPIFIALLKSMVTGIREGQNIDYGKLKEEFMPLPSIEEQQAIASYLDTATAKIDEAIAQQQKMIDLLNERKQIIINNAVTKGLNPNAPMKPSGIDWIGEIPEHWEVSKLKHHSFKIGDGLHGTPVYSEYGNAYFINGNNLRNETISINDSTMKVSDSEYQKHYVPLGDNALLISINGSIGHTSFYNNEKIVLSKSAGYIDLHPSACKQYIRYYLMSTPVLHFFRRQLTGSTIGNLSLETLRNTYFPCPPITEQEVISSFLNRETARIEKAIDSIQCQISTLQERKQIIINDVVTGKVKII